MLFPLILCVDPMLRSVATDRLGDVVERLRAVDGFDDADFPIEMSSGVVLEKSGTDVGCHTHVFGNMQICTSWHKLTVATW